MGPVERVVTILFLFLSALATQVEAERAAPAAPAAPAPTLPAKPAELAAQAAPCPSATEHPDLKKAWLRDNRWRYASDKAADCAYQRLLTDKPSPWPEWHRERVVTLRPGVRFDMALGPGQKVDEPGSFGTFDRIRDLRFVRFSLAVKTKWKQKIDRVVTYEIVSPLRADTGVVGPQIDVPARLYLPGGASQLEMKVPKEELARYLRAVDCRPIDPTLRAGSASPVCRDTDPGSRPLS